MIFQCAMKFIRIQALIAILDAAKIMMMVIRHFLVIVQQNIWVIKLKNKTTQNQIHLKKLSQLIKLNQQKKQNKPNQLKQLNQSNQLKKLKKQHQQLKENHLVNQLQLKK